MHEANMGGFPLGVPRDGLASHIENKLETENRTPPDQMARFLNAATREPVEVHVRKDRK